MKLKTFIENLNTFVKENPDALELDVITAKDAEGNGFEGVHYTPSKGIFEDGDFIAHGQYEDYEKEESDTNAVCIN